MLLVHSIDLDLNIDALSKIEGHGQLDLKVRNGRVEQLRFKIVENKRFYTKAIEGKSFRAAPSLMSRICGTCSIAHLLCCIKSIEKSLDYEPSEQIKILRKLLMYGLMIRDHALHLYFFSLPDVFNKDSVLEFDPNIPEEHEMIHQAFAVKSAGNNLSKLIGGKAVHAPFPMVGGFTKIPDKESINKVLEELTSVRPYIFNLMKIFEEWKYNLERHTTFVAQRSKDYSFMDGTICTTKRDCIKEPEYQDYLERVVIPYSTATGFKYKEGGYFVGALARLNLNKSALHTNTTKDAQNYLKWFPSNNVFDNNLAQAIEILHSIDHGTELLKTDFKPEKLSMIKPKKGSGVGVIEAPRGTLYYKVDINETGTITHADVIVPTQQNQINIEADIRQFVEQNLNMDKEQLSLEIEKIIRAYDPCMSCATHFLKINWL